MKRVVILLIFLLAITSASAQVDFSKQDAANWLHNETKGDESVQEISMALLALNSNGFRIDSQLTTFLQRNLDSNCFPKGSCTVKDTAFALFALGKLNQDTTEIEEWLEGNLRDVNVGKWLIQITSSGQGSCDIRSGDIEVLVDLDENGNLIKEGRNLGNWFDIETELKVIEKSEEVTVSCPTLGSNVIISLLRQNSNNEFRIQREFSGTSATFSIDNSCYGLGSCDAESSFYAAWALDSLNKETKVLPYLEDNAFDNVIYNSILDGITNKDKYALKVANLQNVNGDFGNNIFVTSMAVNSLKDEFVHQDNVTKANLWLQSRQVRDDAAANGSIGGTKFFTGSALYLALTSGNVVVPSVGGNGGYCGDGIIDEGLGEQCDSDFDTIAEGAELDCENRCDVSTCQCNEIQCEEDIDCNFPREYCEDSMCVVDTSLVSCKDNSDCNENEKCDIVSGGYCVDREEDTTDEDSETGCTSDNDCFGIDQVCNLDTGRCEEGEDVTTTEVCGDGLCTIGEDELSCPEDCEEEGGIPVWIWALIFVVALLVLGYIVYANFVSKPPKTKKGKNFTFTQEKPKSSGGEAYYKPMEKDHKDEALERELDRSIKEAQNLLRRK